MAQTANSKKLMSCPEISPKALKEELDNSPPSSVHFRNMGNAFVSCMYPIALMEALAIRRLSAVVEVIPRSTIKTRALNIASAL